MAVEIIEVACAQYLRTCFLLGLSFAAGKYEGLASHSRALAVKSGCRDFTKPFFDFDADRANASTSALQPELFRCRRRDQGQSCYRPRTLLARSLVIAGSGFWFGRKREGVSCQSTTSLTAGEGFFGCRIPPTVSCKVTYLPVRNCSWIAAKSGGVRTGFFSGAVGPVRGNSVASSPSARKRVQTTYRGRL